jgi:transcriptional regulator with XRE-family HTH domain
MSSIGERFKEIRKDAGITQKTFAQSLGISQAHISGIESGESEPSKQLIKAVGSKFGINEKWLLDGDGAKISDAVKDFMKEKLDKWLLEFDGEDGDVLKILIQKLDKNIDLLEGITESIETIPTLTGLPGIFGKDWYSDSKAQEILMDRFKTLYTLSSRIRGVIWLLFEDIGILKRK